MWVGAGCLLGSHPGGIRSGWDQESQAGTCLAFPRFIGEYSQKLTVRIYRYNLKKTNIVSKYNTENSTAQEAENTQLFLLENHHPRW